MATTTFTEDGDVLQTFTVATTGEYEISAVGADGGNSNAATGGAGAEVQGDFYLTSGETIEILVGGAGLNAFEPDQPPGDLGGGAGGGGGVFVVLEGATPADNVLLEAAGGGGGASSYYASGVLADGVDGQAGTGGTDGNAVDPASYAEGTGGAGGSDGSGGGGGEGTNSGNAVAGGGGGAGYSGDGGVTGDAPNGSGDPILTPAQSFQDGGEGGTYPGDGADGVDNGGYGGGGASDGFDGGGGGGYSGGGGGGYAGGGGGGSYVDDSLATNIVLTSGENAGADEVAGGDGLATIEGPACFCRGTFIAIESGATAVENLRVGDKALTARGALRPIVWIGRRIVDVRRHIRPDSVNPVRIEAGALAPYVPKRDLLVSPEHAIWLDEALICAGELVNGATIRQEARREVEYFHVELESHDILLAEDAPAESYLDCGNRRNFANGGDALSLHPEWTPSQDFRLFASPSQLARTKARLAERAAALGRDAQLAAYRAAEEARAQAPRENVVRNPRGEGSVSGRIGQDGAPPAFWRCAAPAGVAVEIAGSGVEAGLPYVDIRFAGCAETPGSCAIYPAPGAAIAAQRGQDWTFSGYLRLVGGGWTGIASLSLYFDEYGPTGDYLDGEPRAIRFPADDALDLQRVSATHRLRSEYARSMTGYVQAVIAAAGTSVDLTLRVAGFQIEQGDYASGLLLPAEGAFAIVKRERGVLEAAQAA